MSEDVSAMYYTTLAADLFQNGLSKDQAIDALSHGVTDRALKTLIGKTVTTKYAQFFTENQYPEPDSAYKTIDNDSSYTMQLKSLESADKAKKNDENNEEVVSELDLDRYQESRNQAINLLTDTAQLADKRELFAQANTLDEILKDLL